MMEEQTIPLTPKDWIGVLNVLVKESTGAELFDLNSTTYEAALVMIAMTMTGSVNDDVLKANTGLTTVKIHKIKHRMRTNGMLHSHKGCRKPSVNFSVPGETENILESLMSFMADAMTAGGTLIRTSV